VSALVEQRPAVFFKTTKRCPQKQSQKYKYKRTAFLWSKKQKTPAKEYDQSLPLPFISVNSDFKLKKKR
jgi:hypothetical protein